MNAERVFATAVVVVAAAALSASLRMPLLVQGVPGPGLMPAASSGLLLLLSLAQLFSSLQVSRASGKGTAGESTEGLLRCLLVVVLSALYVALVGTAGYVPATGLMVMGILMFVYRQSLLTSIGGAALLSSLSYFLFANVLAVQLPPAFPFL